MCGMTHTPAKLRGEPIPEWAQGAPDILRLVHNVTVKGEDGLTDEELMGNVREKLGNIVTGGAWLNPACDGSPRVPGEDQVIYFFWGHIFPQKHAQAVFLVQFTKEHFEQAKGTPFDTGSVLRSCQNKPPRFGYARHVIKCVLPSMPKERDEECGCSDKEMHECSQKRVNLVEEHSASGYDAIKQYFSSYLGVYYNDMFAYLSGTVENEIDGYRTETAPITKGEKNACAFEVRCFMPVHLKGQQWILTPEAGDWLDEIGCDLAGQEVIPAANPEATAEALLQKAVQESWLTQPCPHSLQKI